MGKIAEAPSRAAFPEMEERITKFWQDNKIFEKSIEQRPEDNRYSFVDGPPFVSGMPHPAHLFVSIAKDVIPRYWTMKGKRVRRVFGWDCHGLPIEAKVNQKYNLRGRDQIENEFGVEKYVQECRKYVEEFSENWRWYIERVGRWADMDNAYYTMHPEFNESVIWAFKQAWDKGLIYKGKRVSLYSTDTATPVSNFEVAMDTDNYVDTEDLSVFVKFELKENPFSAETKNKKVYMVAWTTTPWTLPSNFALAVHPDHEYALVQFEGSYYVVSQDRLQYTFETTEENIGSDKGKLVTVLKSFKGKELDGLAYKPVYDFFAKEANSNDYKVYLSEEVTNDEGTGVLHIAPAYGEVDNNFGREKGLSDFADINEEGNMTVGSWKGTYLRAASPLIAEDMADRNVLLRSEMYTHRLPYYRGDNPLIYMAQDSYFLDVQKIKDRMLALNENVNWVPEHFKHGRFAETVATSPDWCVSRNRYWATIMPLWKSEDGDELVVGSIEEMMQYTDQITKKFDKGRAVYYMDGQKMSLHRDFCDKIVLTKDGKEYRRVPEVLDCWFDSGSVPFAEYHYPFENKDMFEKAFPADFIVEYSGQVRAWFNVLFRMAVINFDQYPFKNVICHGVMAGNDGRKMSKTYGNYTDPEEILKNIGGEALRLYAMGSPIMAGGDMNWSDEELNERVKGVLIPFWNTYRYMTLYAKLHEWTPTSTEFQSENILDRWLKEFLHKVGKEYSEALERYDLPGSVKLIQPMLDTLSTWWIRRSRDRFAEGNPEALQTLYAALVYLAKVLAPQMPFLMEEIYQNLVVGAAIEGAKESVHLEDYPKSEKVDEKLLENMDLVREVCSLGLNIRDEKKLKLRQPLAKAYLAVKDQELMALVQAELNVKEVEFTKAPVEGENLVTKQSDSGFVTLDVNLTDELKEEGLLNEVVRQVQVMRKEAGFEVGEKVKMVVSGDTDAEKLVSKFADEMCKRLKAESVTVADQKVKEGTDLKLDGMKLKVLLEKVG